MTYNEIIQKAGKRITKHVSYTLNNQLYNIDDNNVDKIKIVEETPLVGTAMTGCEITLKEKVNGEFNVVIDATYNNETKSASYGKYYLKEEPTYDANKKTYLHKTYDGMIKSMVPYNAITISYPCTLYDYFIELTTELGYTNNISSLPNGSMTLEEDLFEGINYTYRDVLDDIAEANGVVFYIDDNEIKIPVIGGDTITINDDILKNKNIDFKEKYGPVNTIVLSRSYETDVIYLDDPTSVQQNGRNEFKIVDNQIMNGNDRSYYLPAILNRLLGVEYYIYDTELVGYGNLRKLQSIIFNTGGNTYNSYVFNNEIVLTAGYKQAIYNDKPNSTDTDYTYANEVDRELEQASIILNKKIADVDIRGKTINLTADNIAINSTNFNVTKEGVVTASSANLNDASINGGYIDLVYIVRPGAQINPFVRVYSEGNLSYIYITGNAITFSGSNARIAGHTIKIPYIDAGNIDSGTCTLNSTTDTTVYFNKTFETAPIVILTPAISSSNPGECFQGSVVSTSTTSFTAYCLTNLNSASNIAFNWIAIYNDNGLS